VFQVQFSVVSDQSLVFCPVQFVLNRFNSFLPGSDGLEISSVFLFFLISKNTLLIKA
jgi:hypothetical protein